MGGMDIYGYDLKTRKIFWPAAPVNSRRDDFNLVKAGFSNSLWYVSSNRLSADGRDNVIKLEFLPGTFSKVHFFEKGKPEVKLSFRKSNVKSSVNGKDDRGRNYDLDINGNIYLNLDSTLSFAVDSFEVAQIKEYKKLPLPFMVGSMDIELTRNVFPEEGELANGKNKPVRNIIVKDNGTVENTKDDKYMNIRLVDDEYMVVAGAFRRSNKIDAFIKELKDAGYSQAKKGGVYNGLNYVIYGSTKNRQDAMTLLIDARKHNPEAWIKRQTVGMEKDQKDAVTDIITAPDLKPIEAIFVSSELDDKSKYYVALNKNNVVIVAKGFYGPKCLTDPDSRVQGKYLISPEKGIGEMESQRKQNG
jgi:hypothetical protein